MSKTLKLDDSTAKRLYKTADAELKVILEESFGKRFFSDKLIDRIKTIEDIYEQAGIERADVIPYNNPKNKLERQLNAVVDINYITKVLNEDDKFPDFKDKNQYKYYLWFEKRSSGWVVGCYAVVLGRSGLGSGFYFKDSVTALFAGSKFLSIFKDYLPE